MEATRKRKRVSKNKKNSWRKHTDITDVEEYLDDIRLQERTGGIAADKPDEKLFFFAKKDEEDDSVLSKRQQLRQKPLRCHANLEPDSHIKPIISSNVRNNSLKRRCTATREKITNGKLSKIEKQAADQRSEALLRSKNRRRQSRLPFQASYDLWSTDGKKVVEEEYFAKVTKKITPKVPRHMKLKPSELSAVENPHPGASYNPAYQDHQDLLHEAYMMEVKKIKNENRIDKQLDFPTVDQAPTQESWLKEMSAGLTEEDDKGEESFDDSGDEMTGNQAVRRENKKTDRQRKKQQNKKLKDRQIKDNKERRQRDQELFRLKSIKREVTRVEKVREEKLKRKQFLREKFKNKPKKLGKLKYEVPDLEITLTDELSGSLRLIKPEGNLLEDRFNSFQKRNVIETRIRAKFKRKYKDKVFEKSGHKAVTG